MRNYGYFEKGQVGSIKDTWLWRRILLYCRPHLPRLVAAVLLSFLITFATLGLPRIMQMAIDGFMTATDIDAQQKVAGLGDCAFWYGLLIAVIFVGGFLQVVLLEWIGQSIMQRLRQDLFTRIMSLDLSFFSDQPAGRLVTRLTNDIQNMHEMFTSVMVTLFNDFLKLAGILIMLFYMNSRLAGVMSIFVPLSLFITIVFSRLARDRFRAIRTQIARLNSFLQESVSGISIIQMFGREDASRQRFFELTAEYLSRTQRQIRLFGTFMPLTEFMSSVAVALILWYGGGEVLRRQLTLGELVAFLSYMRLFFQPMRELSQKYSIVQSAMASAERIFQLLDKESMIRGPAKPWQPARIHGNISFNNVSFSYDKETEVLHSINLDIQAGETIALVGTTGSGKSTLVNLLVRFYDPDSGQVKLDGRDVRDFQPQFLRHAVGLIMQDVFVLPDTVLANITLDRDFSADRVSEVLDQAGLRDFVEKLPNGLMTRIGEGGIDLSTGEKQLLSFARVLCRDPALLILDEATAAIDTESENMLEKAIEQAFRNRTSIVIAHRLSTIRRADRILVLEQGAIVEQGTHAELMAIPSVYRTLVERDQQQTSFVDGPETT